MRHPHDGLGKLLIVIFELSDLTDQLILLLPHSFELFLHDGVLVDNGVLRLEFVVVALLVLLLNLE